MKTPAGKECQYFYGDYYRGRKREECRLLGSANPPLDWQPSFCTKCPVPDIMMANACTNMILKPAVFGGILGFGKSVRIEAYCEKTNEIVKEPKIGCGQCHPLPLIFMEE